MNWSVLPSSSADSFAIVFLVLLTLYSFIRMHYSFELKEFLSLPINRKYILIFSQKERLKFSFTALFFIFQMLSVGLGICFFLQIQEIHFSCFWVFLITILLFSIKLFIQILMNWVFNTNDFGHIYLFNQLSYSNYASFIWALLSLLTAYTFNFNIYFHYFSAIIFVCILLLGLLSFLKIHFQKIKPYFFYFILYICTLEIMPYFFIGYFVKNMS